jgi:D-sedoheptulose 7-phosphate isomerase
MTSKEISGILIDAFKNDNKVLICGNGGSSSQAHHFAGELVCKFQKDRKALPAICLSADTSVITAIGNDFGFEHIFERQVDALGQEGDVFIGLSTTYNSENIIKAENLAYIKKMKVIRFPLSGKDTPEIQELHLKMIHEICGLVEKAIEEKRL